MTPSRRHPRDARGFTMAEMLAAVAVLVILFAIAAPFSVQLSNNLEMSRLDGTAKSIYLTVQSRMDDLRNNGVLTRAYTTTAGDSKDAVAAQIAATGQLEQATPSDYPGADGSVGDNTTSDPVLYYLLSSDDIVADDLMSSDSSPILGDLTGSWIVEVSPYTGEVYGVFYSESDSLGWDDVQALASRSRDDRTGARIGYYHGGRLQTPGSADGTNPFKDLTFNVVNSEELYAHLAGFDSTKVDLSKLSLTFEVAGTNANGGSTTWTHTWTGAELEANGAWGGNANEVDIILDSMRDGLGFADVYTNDGTGNSSVSSIVPGSDVAVTVSISYDGRQTNAGTITCNSLFGTGSDVTSGTGTINVSCLRHLDNLRSEAITCKDASGASAVRWVAGVNAYQNVSQTADIDFVREDGSDWMNDGSVSVQSRDAEGHAANPLAYLTPITLPDGFNTGNTNSYTTALDATNNNTPYVLKNLPIGNQTNATDEVGLFKKPAINLTNVTFENATAYGRNSVGVLAGSTLKKGQAITNCSVTDSTVTSTSRNAGGLVGVDYADITGCTVKNTSVTCSSYSAGGIVGNVDNGVGITIKDCSTSVDKTDEGGTYLYGDYPITSYQNTGGIVGFIGSSNTIENCTAGVDIVSTKIAGGLIGSAYGCTIKDCSAAGVSTTDAVDDAVPQVIGKTHLGGLIGFSQGGATVTRCFSALDVLPKNDDVSGTQYIGGLIGFTEYLTGGTTISNCYASGDVRGADCVGGLVGLLRGGNCRITSCFSTGNVFGNTSCGGLAGIVNGPVSSSVSYGQVFAADGTVKTTNGGFTGGGAGAITNSTYLAGYGYNDTLTAGNNPASSSWATLTANATISAADTHPYTAALKGKAFPFADTCGLGSYYGGWPEMHTVTWLRGDGQTLATTSVVDSATDPSYETVYKAAHTGTTDNDALHAADYAKTDSYQLFQSWDGGSTDANGNVTYTASYVSVPVVSGSAVGAPLLSDTSMSSITVDGANCSALWAYIDSKCSNKKTTRNVSCDSEAPISNGYANASVWLKQSLTNRGIDTDSFSFTIYITTGTYASSSLYTSGDALLGTNGSFRMVYGAKLPTVASGTAPTNPARVLMYDVAQKKYEVGTVSISQKTGSSAYYIFDVPSFSATSDWFTL